MLCCFGNLCFEFICFAIGVDLLVEVINVVLWWLVALVVEVLVECVEVWIVGVDDCFKLCLLVSFEFEVFV